MSENQLPDFRCLYFSNISLRFSSPRSDENLSFTIFAIFSSIGGPIESGGRNDSSISSTRSSLSSKSSPPRMLNASSFTTLWSDGLASSEAGVCTSSQAGGSVFASSEAGVVSSSGTGVCDSSESTAFDARSARSSLKNCVVSTILFCSSENMLNNIALSGRRALPHQHLNFVQFLTC